ncbi:MAG: HI1506-related protein [Pseudomonadota bacterium]
MAFRVTSTIDGFRRAGEAHSSAGKVWPAEAFTDDEWRAIDADPRLIIEEVSDDLLGDDEPAPLGPSEWAQIGAAIRTLGPDGYGANGKPKIADVRKALDDDGPEISSADLAKVWSDLVASGFKAPEETEGDD